jgi:WhiB family transcriptional regulator, redox-sensing transcriptional regulator
MAGRKKLPEESRNPFPELRHVDTPCQADPESWFPEKGATDATAVRLCNRCPVRSACLDLAMLNESGVASRWGVWGGKTAKERASIDRKARRKATT